VARKPSDLDDDAPAPAPRTSGKAVWSLVLGILSLGCLFITGLPAIILGILGIRDVSRGDGNVKGQGMAITGIIMGVIGSLVCPLTLIPVMIGLLLPAVQKVREAAARMTVQNNMRQIGLGLHMYHDTNNKFPDPAIRDKSGKPLLSWRVAILPYIEQEGLYRQFKLDEPWDSPHNKPLLNQMPKTYGHPAATDVDPTKTYFQLPVGKKTMFPPGRQLSFAEIVDGSSNTIMLVEAATPVPWTKPEDFVVEENAPLPALGGQFPRQFLVILADGSPLVVDKSISEKSLRDVFGVDDALPPDPMLFKRP
jgi:hypothetical protein